MRLLIAVLVLLGPMLMAAAAGQEQAPAQRVLFHDDFGSYPAGSSAGAQWDVMSGEWVVRGGKYVTHGRGGNSAYAFTAPELDTQTVTARMHIGERAASAGWAYAGLQLVQDAANYWQLVLVLAPDGTRYGELGEQYDQVWQAQGSGATQLPKDEMTSESWQPGDYTFTLTLRPAGITGEIKAADGTVVYRGGYRFAPGAPAVTSGRVGVKAVDMAASVSEVTVTGPQGVKATAAAAGPRRAAILSANLPGMPPELPEKLAESLRAQGLPADLLAPAEVTAERLAAKYRLLVIPQCETFPAAARPGLLRYLRSGGNVVFLGGPLWEQLVYESGGTWQTAEEMLAAVKPRRPLVTWAGEDVTKWGRATSNPEYDTKWQVVAEDGRRVLRLDVPHLDGWDNVKSPEIEPPAATDNLLVFRAKANERLGLLLEVDEDDGTRWLTTVTLTKDWQSFAVPFSSFMFWKDGSPPNRGARNDALRVDHIQHFSVGLAHGHASYPTGGPYTVWVGDVGVAPSPLGPQPLDRPTIEAVSPAYKTYPTKATRAATWAGQGIVSGLRIDEPFAAVCPIARARGLGSTGARPGRWIPLLYAYDGDDPRGAVASLYLGLSGAYRHATWTSIGLPDSKDVLAHLGVVTKVVTAVADRAAAGMWLGRGGADRYSYFTDEAPAMAAYVASSGAGGPVTCRLTITRQGATGPAYRQMVTGDLPAGGSVLLVGPAVGRLPAGVYVAKAVLVGKEGRPLDAIEHEFRVVEPPHASPEQIVSQHDGEFWVDGKVWRPHGLNYWPSNVTGLAPFDYWLHWLSPVQYDPAVCELDLARLQKLGVTALSIQLNNRDQVPALNDFLARALAHGIRVNVFLSGAHPLNPDLALCTDMVRLGRFAGNPAIYAYDLAWEPAVGDQNARRRLDPAWRAWIVERYGSVEAAERDWGAPARRDDEGNVTGPSQEQVLNDGDHRIMVAAYRRFLDDHISAGYNRVIAALRPLDDTHLFAARTGYGGTGQAGVDPAMPFDLTAGAKHLDFISPEGYGMAGDYENYQLGNFINQYGRWAGDGKPIFWAEFGYTIYPGTTPERYVEQGKHYEKTYRMIRDWPHGANGSAGWWFPGGLRVDENSDFGVMNPDGTPRPAALAMKQGLAYPVPPAGAPLRPHDITIDRDLHPRGTSQIWQRCREEFLQALGGREFITLRTTGTGTTSADCPAVSIGNTPWTGQNPPKYLNAELNEARAEGDRLVVSMGNTGEAKWLAPKGPAERGAVYLVAYADEGLTKEAARAAIPADVPRYADTTIELALPAGVDPAGLRLTLVAEGRGRFGPVMRVQ